MRGDDSEVRDEGSGDAGSGVGRGALAGDAEAAMGGGRGAREGGSGLEATEGGGLVTAAGSGDWGSGGVTGREPGEEPGRQERGRRAGLGACCFCT